MHAQREHRVGSTGMAIAVYGRIACAAIYPTLQISRIWSVTGNMSKTYVLFNILADKHDSLSLFSGLIYQSASSVFESPVST